MHRKIQKINDDWLLRDYSHSQNEKSLIMAISLMLQVGTECFQPKLTLTELHELIDHVWFQMATQEEEDKSI